MITFLPDPEIQRAEELRRQLQPRNKFAFLWDVFFSRRKFRLTQEEVRELEAAEATAKPWRDAMAHLWKISRDPDQFMWERIGDLKADPSPQNLQAFLASRHVSPVFPNQTQKALDELQGVAQQKIVENVVPLVKKHLARIHDSLVAEYHQQEQADKKSLARLEGIASGGESSSCIELRMQAQRIQGLLDGGDLTDWRSALGMFLP